MNSDTPKTLSPALPAGHLLKEYSLLSVLGMGSFGITYLAADNYLHLKVAIKEYFPSNAAVRNHYSGAVALKSEQAQGEYLWGKDRFMREAQTLARFRHRNIVQVFRYFEGNGTCYMVMAYEEGNSLEQVLADDTRRWDEPSVLALVLPLLEGLESVHEAGFLHRDVKPANIVLRANDEGPVLIDFGAARSPASTDALTVVLSHGYGPPEQYSRESNQGPWTDIYAMAGVLYRIVTGVVPPPSLHRIKNDAMIPAGFAGAGRYSAGFLGAIDLALNVDETKRPQSIGEWRRFLARGAPEAAILGAVGSAIDRSAIHGGAPAVDAGGRRPVPYTSPGAHQAEGATGGIAAAATNGSPSQSRGGAGQPASSRPGQRWQDESEPGGFARLGQAMIAHPFLTLLLLLASIYVATHLLRRSGLQEHPKPPATAPESTMGPTRMEAPAGPRDGVSRLPPVSPPLPANDLRTPGNEAAATENPNDTARIRRPFVEALAACAGKVAGASCSFMVQRNGTSNGTCVLLPNESLVCRPERFGERGGGPPDPLSNRQNADRFPLDNRQPRYR